MSEPSGAPTRTARVSRCTGAACGMRYPSPPSDPRAGVCPRCESPTADLGPYPPAFTTLAGSSSGVRIVAVLDNVRSALNVGTMLRAADGGALEHVVLGGLTPSGDHPKVTKTSLGAERFVPWHQAFDTTTAVDELLDAEWVVWALEATPDSVPLSVATSEPLPRRLAIVVGNETAGVDPALLERAHRHVHLPMAGAKTTLNVGVALGAAIYVIRAAEGSA